ncbi:EamA family transporter [Hahella sp. CCB-MM4]|uniref:DMT family transporter n=1 Tax=Hahella sp. (strain CCB-MM4) TaxID=1926491 RepID=UPI000B9ABE97|nr:DMT family transporter [Hahella sp. CCB-MM4]OZG71900.1 EamA family transporter [Hahella sp. CCB-MM4]
MQNDSQPITTSSTPPVNERKALGFGLAAVLCWSTVAVAFKMALAQMDVAELLFWATLTSVLVMGLVLAVQGKLVQSFLGLKSNWVRALGMGIINPLAYYFVLFAAYDRLPAQVAQPVNYTWAIVLAFMAVIFLGHKISKADFVAMALGYSGVVTISLGSSSDQTPLSFIGLGLAIFSTLLWAGYWIANSLDKRDPVVGLFQNFLMALPLTLILAWPLEPGFKPLLSAVYVGTFEMGITFVLWLLAMKSTRHSSRLGNLIFLSPFISLVLIHLFLGEHIYATTMIGLVLIIAGLIIQNRYARH